MGNLFIMAQVALPAVSPLLKMVTELRRPGMADGAAHARMRRRRIFIRIYERSPCPGQFPGLLPPPGVTVQTETGNPFHGPGIFPGGAVTGHTGFIFKGKGGQGGLLFVTNAALFMTGYCRIKPARTGIFDSQLFVGTVAGHAGLVFFRILNLFPAVGTPFEVIQDALMAGKAMVHMKKIADALVDIFRIRVEGPVPNLFVAVPAGGPTVRGDMKFPGIDEPGGRCGRANPQKAYHRYQQGDNGFFQCLNPVHFVSAPPHFPSNPAQSRNAKTTPARRKGEARCGAVHFDCRTSAFPSSR
jgi:hypothetical protein